MRNMPALPKIEIIKRGKYFEVHWDYQEAPESSVLTAKEDYLRTYIDGALAGLGIEEKKISCAAGRAGAVKALDENTANRLATLLTNLLHPIVTREFKRLQAEAKLPPHLRYPNQGEAEKSMSV